MQRPLSWGSKVPPPLPKARRAADGAGPSPYAGALLTVPASLAGEDGWQHGQLMKIYASPSRSGCSCHEVSGLCCTMWTCRSSSTIEEKKTPSRDKQQQQLKVRRKEGRGAGSMPASSQPQESSDKMGIAEHRGLQG